MTSRPATSLPLLGWVFLGVLYVATVYVTIVTRVQWGPDTAFHLAWTFRLLGDSEPEAVRRTVEFLADKDGIDCATSSLPWCHAENYQMYFAGDYAATVGPRVMTRLLSAPFVAVFGPWSMVAVSVVAYAAGVACLAVLAARMFGPRWGLLAGALAITPWLAANWAVHANTEALAMAFTTAAMLALPLRRRAGWRDVVAFAVLLGLGLFTRQFAVSVTVGTVLAWLVVAVRDRQVKNAWAPFAAAGAAATAVIVWVQGQMTASYAGGFSTIATYENNTGTHGLAEVVASVPATAARIVAGDWDHIRTDLVLTAVLLAAALSVAWRFRSELSALVVGMIGTTLALNLIVNDDSIFRYHTPNYPVYVLAAVALLADLAAGRRPSATTESPTPPGPRAAPPSRVPVAAWGALGIGYVVLALVIRNVNVGKASVGSGPALPDPTVASWPESVTPILAYGAAVALVAWQGSRLWGRSGLVAAALMLVPSVMVPLARAEFLEPFAALAVAAALCALPWRGGAPRGGPLWFGAGVLLATAMDPFAGVVAAGTLVAWATRLEPRNPWAPYPLVGAAAVAAALGVRAASGRDLVGTAAGDPAVVVDWIPVGSDFMLIAVAALVAVVGVRAWRDEPAVPLALGAMAAALALCATVDAVTGLRPVTALMPVLALAGAAAVARPLGRRQRVSVAARSAEPADASA
ncbi:glycosyltransferase family 39 protein [Phytohabitans sp. ZYX-F-186]|uniref:Glycosyltransferase family 39 protein n=1 Tax=Phytohabitans maris TaxID=3071409 RepID=A0ABU0ZAC3_9ACTN|nr:glycosyltransferase family 39 protein [Phytohabitans sp. ZYX-F-186]MDQ7903988.1 glycosyltransferase family 39 protein [Phytohabitans sp. ZYX-F-186]